MIYIVCTFFFFYFLNKLHKYFHLMVFILVITSCGAKNVDHKPIQNKNGLNSLIITDKITTNNCESGIGYVVSTGLDKNENDALDLNEVQSTQLICDGKNGNNGKPGLNGIDGLNMVYTIISAIPSQCSNGGYVLLLALDSEKTGVYNSWDIDQQSIIVCNGQKGDQGITGESPKTNPVTVITPCGKNSSPWKEVLLCLNDGNVLASFSQTMSGDETRLSFLSTGNYIDTDDSGCTFNVNVDDKGNTEVSWSSGSNQYSSWIGQTIKCNNMEN